MALKQLQVIDTLLSYTLNRGTDYKVSQRKLSIYII